VTAPATEVDDRRDLALAALGALLAYPEADVAAQARALAGRLAPAGGPDAAVAALGAFADEVERWNPGAIEEIYTRTFDVAPLCAPYLSVHLFGEESMHRPRLMTGLADAWRLAGVSYGGELPDHVAIVVAAGPALPPGEWDELLRRAVLPALTAMCDRAAPSASPYRHVLAAAHALLAARAGLSTAEARALRRPLVVLPPNAPGASEMNND
jgi:nitrate reductase assembly molybdenum cofactor insertion protein NarJ